MARRGHIGGGRQGFQIDPSVFLRGGGGDDKGDTEMAMALMGYGKGGGPQGQALDERQQAAQELFQSGQLANMEAQRRIQEAGQKSEAEARTANVSEAAQRRLDDLAKEATRRQEQADTLAANKEWRDRSIAKDLVDTLVKEQKIAIGDPEYKRLMEQATPGYGEAATKAEAIARESDITKGLANYQKAAPKGKTAMALGLQPDIYNEVLKRAGVQVAPTEAAAPSGGLQSGAQDVLWNLPGGVENLYNWMANVGGKAWYGKDAPQYPYVPWTRASEEIPKYTAGGPPVAPAPEGPMPRPQFGSYGVQAEPAETPPEWQYGVGQQRPPASLNDLLAKALQGQ